ncbi:MAG: hypothetical protein Aurels2KO_39340 [Aureliella sp.]
MPRYSDSCLYRSAFGQTSADSAAQADQREALRRAFEDLRVRVEPVASEVAKTLPQLTDHSIQHLDALWDVASVITGGDFQINPVEGLILGAAFLLHDLGNAIAAYPNRLADLKGTEWDDTVVKLYIDQYERRPTHREIQEPASEIYDQVLLWRLRDVHAEACIRLACDGIIDQSGNVLPIIENSELREELGATIGKVASSHHWDISTVVEKLAHRTAYSGGSSSWEANLLVLACILRCADACHIDRRRASPLLMALRRPVGGSVPHWRGQQRIGLPILNENTKLLEFRSTTPFLQADRQAWQIIYEMASGWADKELRKCDLVLRERHMPRFAAIGIAGVEDPESFSQFIETESWSPINLSVRITNVAKVVEKFGGRNLYGNDNTVPLRELIANAADAIRARRAIPNSGLTEDQGTVTIRFSESGPFGTLSISDDGVGMSTEVLRHNLLNFGSSFWASDLVLKEFPGLLSTSFRPTGKFGVGFFSAFMIGTKVQIITRRFADSVDSTQVLELEKNELTPLVRKARIPEEGIASGGTIVSIQLSDELWSKDGICPSDKRSRRKNLAILAASIAPALDVNVEVQIEDEQPFAAISANDWLSIPFPELLKRLEPAAKRLYDTYGLRITGDVSEQALILGRSEVPSGRIRLVSDKSGWMICTVGGLSTNIEFGCGNGLLTASTDLVSRSSSLPMLNQTTLRSILEKSLELKFSTGKRSGFPVADLAALMLKHGLFPKTLRIFNTHDYKAMTYSQFVEWATNPRIREIALCQDTEFSYTNELDSEHDIELSEAELRENVVVLADPGNIGFFKSVKLADESERAEESRSLGKFFILALCDAWRCAPDDIELEEQEIVVADFYTARDYDEVEVSKQVVRFIRPNK